MLTLSIKTARREEFIDLTARIEQALSESTIKDGNVTIHVPHTTAAVTINENADPAVFEDILYIINSLIPHKRGYRHLEGNSDAHAKASLFGSSINVLLVDGKLKLGRWQGIFFCEFDGPRTRNIWMWVSPII